MIVYRGDVIARLKEKGYSTYRIRKEKIIGESTLQKIRDNEMVSWENLNVICRLLQCQPGDILEYHDGETKKDPSGAGGESVKGGDD